MNMKESKNKQEQWFQKEQDSSSSKILKTVSNISGEKKW